MSWERVVQPLVACVGNPVGGNPTQFVMTRLAREAELDWRFFTSQVDEELFETAFRGVQALGMSGAAILPPFQTSVDAFLGSISARSKALGAVQVAKWEDGQWIGDETLTSAILRALTHRISSMVSKESLDSEAAFDPQSLGVVGTVGLTQALQLAVPEIPGDYQVSAFELHAKRSKSQTSENHSESESISETTPASPPANDELAITDRPVRALIVEQLDAIMSLSSHARHRLLKDTHWAKCPIAILVPPPTGWVDATKERSQWIEELESHEIQLIDELEILTQQFAINFEFWTGYEPPLDSIRESLEEYLQW